MVSCWIVLLIHGVVQSKTSLEVIVALEQHIDILQDDM